MQLIQQRSRKGYIFPFFPPYVNHKAFAYATSLIFFLNKLNYYIHHFKKELPGARIEITD